MFHFKQGSPTRQGHKAIPDGFFEEEQGLDGFYGPVSHLIKEKPSTRWINIEGELKPRMFDLVKIPVTNSCQRLFFNQDITISNLWMQPDASPKKALRNADGDWLYFCHKGSGTLLTEYGALDFTPGTYIIVQKCITHSFILNDVSNFLLIENRTSHYRGPDRGMVGRHAPYDMNTLGCPDLEKMQALIRSKSIDVREIAIKHLDHITQITYDATIFDTVGWKGDLFPYTLHMDHIMPLMSHRVHLPPSAHTTFVAKGFVICSFLPRPLEQDQDALRVPFYHQNIDYDEVLFYHAGDFFSRDNLHAGMLSLHPAGFPHGPHPKAIDKVKAKTHTDEYAVMIDSRWPLQRDPALAALELSEYWKSWMKK
jgi:homogentisate 1,2-dioxygenase